MLLFALALEVGDLELHGAQRLLHRGQRLEHAAFRPLAIRLRLLLGVMPLDEFAVLVLVRSHLALEPVRRRSDRGEL